MRQRRAHDALLRGEQHRERPGPDLFVVRRIDRRKAGDAGIVDDDVEAAEFFRDLAHHARDLAGVAHVHLPAARGCCEVGGGDQRAFRCENFRRGAAHAAGGAGDEDYRTADRAKTQMFWHDGPMKIDLLSPESFAAGHPHAQYRWLRENAPVFWHEEPDGKGFWAVTRFKDVWEVDRDFQNYSPSPRS